MSCRAQRSPPSSADGGHNLTAAAQLADFAVGACLVVASAIAWRRRSSSQVWMLFGLAGVTWFAGSVFVGALYLHRGPLVHLLLAYPTGRARNWLSRVAVVVGYATAIVYAWAQNDSLTIIVAGLVAVAAASEFLPAVGPTRRALLPTLGAALAYAGVLAFSAIRPIGRLGDH